MQSPIISGKAPLEEKDHLGWFIGHFITPATDPRSTSLLEMKWGIHKAGESRQDWASSPHATSLSILISGRFCLQFPNQEIILTHQGDYALWGPGVFHSWLAEEDSTILTVRWPSKPPDF